MKSKKLILFLVLMGIYNMSANLIHPITPTLIVERNLDSSMFGVAFAAMMTAFFIMAPFWGKLCAYVPTKRIILICCLGYTAGQIVFGMAMTEGMVIAGRMLAGSFSGGIMTAFSNYTINTSASEQRGKNLTLMLTVQNVTAAIGYFVGGLLGLVSINFTFVWHVIILVSMGALMFIFCEDDTKYKHIPEKPLSIREANPFAAFANAKTFMTPTFALVFAIVAIAGIGQNSFEQCFNYYIKDQFNMTSAYNGIIKAAIAAATLVVNSTLVLWMQKKTDINKTFLPLMAVQSVFLAIVLGTGSIGVIIACDIIFFTLNAARLPVLQNMVAMRSTPENSNAMMGFYQSMNSLGGIFGALFAGLIYEANPIYPFILAFAAFTMAVVIGVVYVTKYKKEKGA